MITIKHVVLQVWRATSNYTLQDYTGQYTLELIPCTANPSQPFTPPPSSLTNATLTNTERPACTPNPPTLFPLSLALRQTQRPVPLTYTLDTDFHLLTDLERFLADPTHHPFTQVLCQAFDGLLFFCLFIHFGTVEEELREEDV